MFVRHSLNRDVKTLVIPFRVRRKSGLGTEVDNKRFYV